MTPITAHRARVILHRANHARTDADLMAIGDDLGIPRDLPPATWLRTFQRRMAALIAVGGTVPYVAGRAQWIVKN